jgi:ribosomal-protein-alanine N-acetyltransferase
MSGTTLCIPTLATERLTLRAPRISDFETYAAFCGSERVRVLGGPFSRSDAFEKMAALIGQWALRGFGRWMVADKKTDEPLGVVGLFFPDDWPEPEIAWSVFDPAEGRGIAYEAAVAARGYAYGTLGMPTVISMIAPGNTRSLALARRMGATFDRLHQHPEYGEMHVWRHQEPEAVL